MSAASTYRYGAHVRANGIRQHYLRYGGQGPAVIVVPGISSPAVTWGFVAERLGADFDTYVLDVRGRGLSEAGPALGYRLDDYADDVAGFIAALGLPDCRVLGHSMGARVAIRLGRRHPTGIARLVLADPPMSGPGRRPYGRPLAFYMAAIDQAREGRLTLDAVRETYPRWSEENIRLRAEWLHTCDASAIAETVRGFQQDDVIGDLPALTMPALLVVAGQGGVITADDIAEAKALQPGLEVTTIQQAGHMIPFDDLDAFLAAIGPFLARR